MTKYLVNITDRVICAKSFTKEELQSFRNAINLNYLAEFNIGRAKI